MSISPQLVTSARVAGLLRGSSVVGLARCCSPLFVGFAGLQAPPEAAPGVVAPVCVALVVVFAVVSVSLLPQPAPKSSSDVAAKASTGRDMAAQDNHGLRAAVSPHRRLRPCAARPGRV